MSRSHNSRNSSISSLFPLSNVRHKLHSLTDKSKRSIQRFSNKDHPYSRLQSGPESSERAQHEAHETRASTANEERAESTNEHMSRESSFYTSPNRTRSARSTLDSSVSYDSAAAALSTLSRGHSYPVIPPNYTPPSPSIQPIGLNGMGIRYGGPPKCQHCGLWKRSFTGACASCGRIPPFGPDGEVLAASEREAREQAFKRIWAPTETLGTLERQQIGLT